MIGSLTIRHVFPLLLLVSGLAVHSSQTLAGPRAEARAGVVPAHDTTALVWPSAPARTRIRHLRTISSLKEFTTRNEGFFARVLGFLFGESGNETWLVQPVGIAISANDVMYVADPGAHGVHIIDQRNQKYSFVSETKFGPLHSPVGIALGENGSVYVSDSEAGAVFIADDELEGRKIISGERLRRPTGLAYIQHKLFMADAAFHRISIFTPDGAYLDSVGHRGTGEGEFNYPVSLTGKDTMFVVDALNYRIQKFSPDGTFAGSFGKQGNVAGRFASPKAIAQDSEGNLYVTDALMDNIQIFNAAGQLLLIVGRHGTHDGEFMNPSGIAVDSQNRIYVVDSLNRRIQIFQYIP